MFSKSDVASGATILLLSSLNSVQSLTTTTAVTYSKDLTCSECIRAGFEYDYGFDMWKDSSSFSEPSVGACYTTAGSGITLPSDTTGVTKSTFTSAVFTDKDYAVNACPQRNASGYCDGARLIYHNE